MIFSRSTNLTLKYLGVFTELIYYVVKRQPRKVRFAKTLTLFFAQDNGLTREK